LSHLLLNLTVFCVRASDGQPVRVAARCAPAPSGGAQQQQQQLVLEVSARGHTLCAERAFEPYAQPDSAAAADAAQQVRAGVHACIHARSCALGNLCLLLQAAGSQSRLGLHVSRRLAEGAPASSVVRAAMQCACSLCFFSSALLLVLAQRWAGG
jgi:hypothetical protein